VDWSTLACGRRGHLTYAPDEPAVQAQLSGQAAGEQVWRCLRCGAFVPGQPDLNGPAAQAPPVARGQQIRSHLILKLFAIERFLRVLIFGTASVVLWRFRHSQSSIQRTFQRDLPLLQHTLSQLGYNIDRSRLVGLFRHALFLSSHTITLLAIGTAVYAAIELVEATGLWLARRWGEYLAMIATSLGLPLEIYDLSRKVTTTAIVLLAVNLALVLYLAITKRLFGIRGGKRAYDERLREDSIMDAAIERAGPATARPTAAHSATALSPPASSTALEAREADARDVDVHQAGAHQADARATDPDASDAPVSEGEPGPASDAQPAGHRPGRVSP
jgi:uncharacterized membrane protein (DUF2068 family)